MDRFRRLVRHLRKQVPPRLPVRVYLRDRLPDGHVGECWRVDYNGRGHHFVIVVTRRSWDVMKDTLLHEWSHALAPWRGNGAPDHGPEWGLAMSKVYSAAVPD